MIPVHTAWDLGYNDSTSVWWYQLCGQEIHLLEYYENSGEPLTHYLQLVKNKPYTYGKHIVPQDAAVHECSKGLSRVEVARNHSIPFTIAPDIALIEGIDAVRNVLNRCWFEEIKGSASRLWKITKKNGMIVMVIGLVNRSTTLLVMEQMLLGCWR